jgi:hypothetical protein
MILNIEICITNGTAALISHKLHIFITCSTFEATLNWYTNGLTI